MASSSAVVFNFTRSLLNSSSRTNFFFKPTRDGRKLFEKDKENHGLNELNGVFSRKVMVDGLDMLQETCNSLKKMPGATSERG